MIFRYLGYLLSIILIICSIVLFVVSVYVSYKYSDSLLPTQKSISARMKYSFLSMLSFFSSLFIFLTTENGFSWENVGVLLGIIIALSILLYIDFLINRRSLRYLRKRSISLPSLWGDNPIKKLYKNSRTLKESSKDKEDKQ